MLNIIVTQTPRGVSHFDTPKKGQNKDLYSALVLAGWGVRELSRAPEFEEVHLQTSGLLRPHQAGAHFAITPNMDSSRFASALLKRREK